MQEKYKFYEAKWFMWLVLFFLTPVGIFLLWKYNRYHKVVRSILSVVFAIPFLVYTGFVILIIVIGIGDVISGDNTDNADASFNILIAEDAKIQIPHDNELYNVFMKFNKFGTADAIETTIEDFNYREWFIENSSNIETYVDELYELMEFSDDVELLQLLGSSHDINEEELEAWFKKWRAQMVVKIIVIAVYSEEARTLLLEEKVPESMTELHYKYLEAIESFHTAMELLAEGISDLDGELLKEGINLMSAGSEIMSEAVIMMEETKN